MANRIPPSEDRRIARRSSDTGFLLLGGVLGALIGVGAAFVLLQAKEQRARETDDDVPMVTSGGLARIGLLVYGFLRQIGDIARGE
jgi:hypothetical protein